MKYQNQFLWTAVKFTEIIHALQMTNPFFYTCQHLHPTTCNWVTTSQTIHLVQLLSQGEGEKTERKNCLKERNALHNGFQIALSEINLSGPIRGSMMPRATKAHEKTETMFPVHIWYCLA